MKITKRQMRRIIKEEMAHPQSGLGKSITDAEFPIVVSYEDRSEIAYNQDDLDDILNDIGPRGIKYSLDSLEDMEPSARPVGGSIEQLGESMKITRKQLRRIIKEQLSGYDNIEAMNRAVMDAIFKDPMTEEELVRVATAAAPAADESEVLDFIDELLDQGTIEFDETTGMYDLP